MKVFDINEELQQIEDHTHFWCKGHACAVPISQRAAFDSDYCHDCAKLLRDAKTEKKNAEPVRWSPGGNVCIIDGQGYKVNKAGKTYGVGPVDEKGKSRSGDDVEHHAETLQDGGRCVPKIKHGGEHTRTSFPIETVNYGTKKRRGRPRINDDLSRRTLFRRKAEQAAMAI